jgi:hypothetical protein
MNSYYIFVRVKKAIESRFLMLEHAFSGLVSRENVKIRLFFCKTPVLDEKMFLCNKKTKYMAMILAEIALT